jgi:hypothetical protein
MESRNTSTGANEMRNQAQKISDPFTAELLMSAADEAIQILGGTKAAKERVMEAVKNLPELLNKKLDEIPTRD